MTKLLLIASILLLVAAATTRGARYGTGDGLDPSLDISKSDASGGSDGASDNPNFAGVNGPSHAGVNGGQNTAGTYGGHAK